MSHPFQLPVSLLDETMVDVAAGLAVFANLLAVYFAFSAKEAVNSRARVFARRRRELRATLLRPSPAPKQEKYIEAVRDLLEGLKLNHGVDARKATDLLAQAGFRTPEALTVLFGFRLIMPILIGVATLTLASILLRHLPVTPRLLIGFAGVGAGAFAPSLFLTNARQDRCKKIQTGLPDALDLFVICAEAGLSLDAAVSRVAREIRPATPELADELGLTAVELGFFPNRRDALLNLNKRVPLSSIRNLVTTLAQTERYGTPLADSLRVLAEDFRETRMAKAEEKAARLPAILTVPMIVFILPPLFVVLVGPAAIQVLASLPR